MGLMASTALVTPAVSRPTPWWTTSSTAAAHRDRTFFFGGGGYFFKIFCQANKKKMLFTNKNIQMQTKCVKFPKFFQNFYLSDSHFSTF